ncbi:hypothetical protein ABPG75_006294 [Micractinium tetrahymenae]
MRAASWQGLLVLLLLAADDWSLRATAQPSPAQLTQEQTYVPKGFVPPTVLAPSVAVGGVRLGGAAAAASAEECSARCQNATGCSLFQWCSTQGGCSAGAGAQLGFQTCQLLSSNCTLIPAVEAQGAGVQVVSGFPLREAPQAVLGFTEVPGQGIAGADFSCPMSVLPGKCAYKKLLDAATMCVDALQCTAVVWFFNGTDGCSDPVAVLKSDGLSPDNTFVTPGVSTLQQVDNLPAVSSRLYLPDGQVILPSGAELEAAAAAAAAANRSLGNDTSWRGCFVGRHAIMDGDVVGVLPGVQTAEECCRQCRALERNNTPACNVVNYCNATAGCSYTDAREQTYTLGRLECELRWQPLSVPSMGWPPNLLAKDPAVPFYAGAPISVWGPLQPGYERHLGFGLFTYGRYNCSDSLSPQLQECAHPGSMASFAAFCEADPQCVGFILKPGKSGGAGGWYLSQPSVGIFKHNTAPDRIIFNPTGVLYLREGMDGSGDLSAGAIAGIAVGCAAAVALLGAAAWLVLRRRRRQRLAAHAAGGKATECSASTVPGDLETAGEPSGSVYPPPAPLEQQSTSLSQLSEQRQQAPRAMELARAPSHGLVSPFTSSAVAANIFDSPSRLSSGEATPALAAGAAGAAGAAVSRADSVAAVHPGARLMGRAGSRPPRPPGSQRISFDDFCATPPNGVAGPAAALGHMSSLQSPATPSMLASRDGSAAVQLAAGQRHGSGSTRASLDAGGSEGPGEAAMDREHSALLSSASTGGLPGTAPLPELVQHVAEQDVLAVGSLGGSGSSASSDTPVPLSVDSLPPRLREWLVNPALVEYLRWPNGKLQELGAGASAHVYRAILNGEIIAAKEIEVERSPQMLEAFLTEALRLQALRHPHVICFIGVMLKENKGVVLTEYAEGRDLHSALELMAAGTHQRLFGWSRRGRRVAYDIAKALNYLHSKGIVHMDIKSSNVLLTASGTAKLADVAFSRLQQGTFLSDLPLVGTFAWVAPEILMGGRNCTAAVDIYSFGVVLWEIITGERPQRGRLRSPKVPDECPREVADLLDRMLSQDPAERPTAPEVLQELGQLLSSARSGTSLRRRSGGTAAAVGRLEGMAEQQEGPASHTATPPGSPKTGAK